MVKFSILAYYWRVFGQARKVRITIYILTSLQICWTIAVVRYTLYLSGYVAYILT